ncbi:MAG: hypothetical protein ACKO2P_19530 [Planctomycetota bacterium]
MSSILRLLHGIAGQYRGMGTVMIAAAIQLRLDEGNQGRLGLLRFLRQMVPAEASAV